MLGELKRILKGELEIMGSCLERNIKLKCDRCGELINTKMISTFRFTDGKHEHGWVLCYLCGNDINNILMKGITNEV